jgi:hypothetical protein
MILLMLLVLVGSFLLIGGLVSFCERVIRHDTVTLEPGPPQMPIEEAS